MAASCWLEPFGRFPGEQLLPVAALDGVDRTAITKQKVLFAIGPAPHRLPAGLDRLASIEM
jgi:hypothetical protein